ncbi:MAG: ABC transporter ATP-binding protein [Patescibacteria group bacterium]
MNILSVSNLTKRYGKYLAVNNISFKLREGEILGILGPNGAGKTTTIQMLLGVLTPTAGDISYFGKNFKENREFILERVNFSSTYTNLPWTLTVKESFSFISYFYDIKNRKKRINEIVSLFKLKDLYNSEIKDLSAGELTRVNLAKAFINYPKVLLLDEPTASLDPDIAKYLRKFIINESEKFKVSIILTSHNMAEVEEVCDRVIFLNKGKIIADNTPEKLAKSIKIAHVELFITDGLKRTLEFCKKSNYEYKESSRFLRVDIAEERIHIFLKELANIGVNYNQISIDKPSLEDYFLQVVSK